MFFSASSLVNELDTQYNDQFLCAYTAQNHHSFSAPVWSCDVRDDGKTHVDVTLADTTDDTSDNKHGEVM